MDAGLLDVLHHARNEHVLAIAERVDVDLDRVGEIAVEQQRVLSEHRVDLAGLVVGIARLDVRRHEAGQHAEEIIVERGLIVDDRHRPPAQDIGGAHHQRQAEIRGDKSRLFNGIGDPVLGLLQAQFVKQALEPVAVLGKVDRIDRRAQDRRARLFDRARELERGLAAELHDHALQRSLFALLGENREHVLRGQRLEIEAIRRVVIRRDRLRIAIDHDRLVARLAQRERGVAAAIVELDPLPDPVRTAAEDDDLAALGRVRLAGRRSPERRFIGRVHIGRRRGELGGAGVDALVDRRTPSPAARAGDHGLLDIGERGEARVGEARRLQGAQIARVFRQAEPAHLALERDHICDLFEKPRVDLGGVVDVGDAHAVAHDLRDLEQPIRRRLADRGAHRVDVVALAEALDLDFVEAGEPRLQRAQRLLQQFGEGTADRHRLAHRLHRRRQHGDGAGNFSKAKRGILVTI